MSNIRSTFDKTLFIKTKTSTTEPKKYPKIKQSIVRHSEVAEENEDSQAMLKNKDVVSENAIYVAQLRELTRIFSSSGDRQIRQYIINITRGVIERSDNYKKVEVYIDEVLG